MNGKTSLICVTCPMGCRLDVTIAEGKVIAVDGHACKRGLGYAEDEIIDPRRVVTTTVRVPNGLHPLLPVYTDAPFPKGRIFALLRELQDVTACAPIEAGQVILADALGTGIRVLASRSMPQRN